MSMITQLASGLLKKPVPTNTDTSTSPASNDSTQAPATSNLIASSEQRDEQGLQRYSCVLCKERKIKCDRNDPCAACAKARVTCVFKKPDPPKRRKRGGDEMDESNDGAKGAKAKEATEGQKRKQKKYEDMLRRAGVDVDEQRSLKGALSESPSYLQGGVSGTSTSAGKYKITWDDPHQVSSPPSVQDTLTETRDRRETYPIINPYAGVHEKGRLVTSGNKARYMESNLWKVVSAEASQAVLDGSSEDDSDDDTIDRRRPDDQYNQTFHSGGLLLGIAEVEEFSIQHPDPATILRLWQIFLDHCNPILKLIHAPTLQQEIISAIANLNNISKSLEALMCSIYTLAVMSLTPGETKTNFGESKEVLFSRYSGLVRRALLNSNILRTSDITVLVAFVLYIISLSSGGDFESRWELSGVAMRIAQRIGLHKDPETLGVDPFNCELRRRLWNQIWVLDVRSAEFAGCKTALPPDSDGVKAPTNCSDSSLFPGMKALPPDQEGFTEMSFILLRVRLGQFLRTIGPGGGEAMKGWDWIVNENVPAEDKRTAIESCEEMMLSITRHCDMDVPIQATTCRMASIVISKLKWLAHHPRRGVQAKEDQFKYATDLVEVEVDTRLNPLIKRFMWHAANTLQFDSVFFILAELRRRFTGADIDRAWYVLERVYQATPITSIKNSKIFSALRYMTIAAWDAREAALGPQQDTPIYIQELRKARNSKKSKRVGLSAPQYPTPQSQVQVGSSMGSAAHQVGNPLAVESPAVLSENATSPALFGNDVEEIDWQLWDQMFAQGNADFGPHGEWSMGFKGN